MRWKAFSSVARMAPKPRPSIEKLSVAFCSIDARLEFDAVPEIVIVEAGAVGDAELLAVEIEFVAIDDGPERALGQRKFAGEDAGLQRGGVAAANRG